MTNNKVRRWLRVFVLPIMQWVMHHWNTNTSSFKSWYQNVYSPQSFRYILYGTSWYNLFKDQDFFLWLSFAYHNLYVWFSRILWGDVRRWSVLGLKPFSHPKRGQTHKVGPLSFSTLMVNDFREGHDIFNVYLFHENDVLFSKWHRHTRKKKIRVLLSATFAIACLPPSRSSIFVFAPYRFFSHVPATQLISSDVLTLSYRRLVGAKAPPTSLL